MSAGSETTKRIRAEEAKRAAQILGARFHEPFCSGWRSFTTLKTCPVLLL
jgi:hypothetical protein